MPVVTDETQYSTDAVTVVPAGNRVASLGTAAKLEIFPSHKCLYLQSGSAISVTSMCTSIDAQLAI